jgi:hypothetical protein
MLADTPSPRGSGAKFALVGTLSEGFERSVASPLLPLPHEPINQVLSGEAP